MVVSVMCKFCTWLLVAAEVLQTSHVRSRHRGLDAVVTASKEKLVQHTEDLLPYRMRYIKRIGEKKKVQDLQDILNVFRALPGRSALSYVARDLGNLWLGPTGLFLASPMHSRWKLTSIRRCSGGITEPSVNNLLVFMLKIARHREASRV